MLLQLYTFMNIYFARFNREEGQGMAEYALIIALVAIVLIAGLGVLSGGISDVFTNIKNGFTPAAAP